jgi:hypothetical protein
MLKQGNKTKENDVKHIKKVDPQPTKISAGPKPGTGTPRTSGACIPVGE